MTNNSITTIYDNNYSLDEILTTNYKILNKIRQLLFQKIRDLQIIEKKISFINRLKEEEYPVYELKVDALNEKKILIKNLETNIRLILTIIRKFNYKKNKVLTNINYLEKLELLHFKKKIYTIDNINLIFQVYEMIYNNLNKDLEELRVAYNINMSFLKKNIKINKSVQIIDKQIKKTNEIITTSYLDLNNLYLVI